MPRQAKDKSIHRYVVRLTLYDNNPDHVPIIEMLEESGNKGMDIISAMIKPPTVVIVNQSGPIDDDGDIDDDDDLSGFDDLLG